MKHTIFATLNQPLKRHRGSFLPLNASTWYLLLLPVPKKEGLNPSGFNSVRENGTLDYVYIITELYLSN